MAKRNQRNQHNKNRPTKKQPTWKRWGIRILTSTLVIGIITAIITTGVPAYWDYTKNKNDKAYAFAEKSLEKVYIPVYQVLVYKVEPITIAEYIMSIDKIVKGNEILLSSVTDDFIALKRLNTEYEKIKNNKKITDAEKEQKKAELLRATRVFQARFNERFQQIVKEYYSSIGQQIPQYHSISIVIYDKSSIKIIPIEENIH